MTFVRLIFLAITIFSSTGCAAMFAAEGASEDSKAINVQFVCAENKKNLEKMGYGISKNSVLQIMGNAPYHLKNKLVIPQPYKKETHRVDGKTVEVLYYVTDVKGDGRAIPNEELTPIVIEDGRYTGWGKLHLGVVGLPAK